MAQRVVKTVISDMSGTELSDRDGESIEFAYRGVQYVIDLTKKEARDFDKALSTYVEHASVVQPRRGSSSKRSASKASPGDLQEIREWARSNGFEVADRGRVKAEVIAAFEAAR